MYNSWVFSPHWPGRRGWPASPPGCQLKPETPGRGSEAPSVLDWWTLPPRPAHYRPRSPGWWPKPPARWTPKPTACEELEEGISMRKRPSGWHFPKKNLVVQWLEMWPWQGGTYPRSPSWLNDWHRDLFIFNFSCTWCRNNFFVQARVIKVIKLEKKREKKSFQEPQNSIQ